jgi:putative zinc finger protein
MTHDDARESLSAFLDEELPLEERREVAAHIEGCPECRRELAHLEQTVALLRRVEPARAPVGFVDRVLEAARPRPWYRRAAAAVFLPFSVKLPAEATALVMVALLAVYVFERTPALQESARPQPGVREIPREKTARPAPPTALTDRFARDSSIGERSPESKARPVEKDQDRREVPAAREKIASEAETPKQEAAPRLDAAPPVAAPPAAPAPAAPAAPAPGAAPPASKVEGALQKSQESQAENRQAPVPPTAEGSRGALAAPASPRLAAKRAGSSADAVAGIAVRDRDAAERDLTELIARVGGRETGRRREEEATVVEAIVPQARYAEFTQSLGRLGSWRVEAERPDLPAQVHVILRLQ